MDERLGRYQGQGTAGRILAIGFVRAVLAHVLGHVLGVVLVHWANLG